MKEETTWAILGSVLIICTLVGVIFVEPAPTREQTEEEKRINIYSNCKHTCTNVDPKQECINQCLNYIYKN